MQTLRKGSKGPEVIKLKELLAKAGYMDAPDEFGSQTWAAVKGFQISKEITIDGIAGPQTLAALEGKIPDEKPQGRILGLDVSHHQAKVDFVKVAKQCKFIFLKATEGTGFVDKTYAKRSVEARNAGLLVGAYHFFSNDVDPLEQAKHFCKTIKNVPVGDLPPVLDLEMEPKKGINKINKDIERRALKFIGVVEDLCGVRPIVYSSYGFIGSFEMNIFWKNYPLWVANYKDPSKGEPKIPKPWTDYSFWQFSESHPIEGAGTVDANYFNGDLELLKSVVKK